MKVKKYQEELKKNGLLSDENKWLSLQEFVYKMVQEKKIDSLQFQSLIEVFGKEKLRKLYLAEQEKRKCK